MSSRAFLKAAAGLAALVAGGLALQGCGSTPVDVVAIDPSSVARDLVAHWSFDATAGTVLADDSGNGLNGTLIGGTWIPSGRFAGALRFAPGDHVTVSGFPQAAASWTVSLWIRTSAADLAASTTEWATIISTETVFAGGWQVYLDNLPNFQRFDAAYWGGAALNDYVLTSCACIEVDRWIHLTTVWDAAAAEMRFYRDDQVMGRTPMPMPILPGDTTLHFGTWNMGGRELAGDVDDVAIWRRVLQPAEIAALSMRPATP